MVILTSFFLGLGLAASAGFRVFLPLLAMSLAAHFNFIPLAESWAWVGSVSAILALAVASVIEILAYYIPWVDNMLDTISVPLAGVAGTMLMAVALTDVSPFLQWGLAIIAGGGAASTISATSATTRMASSVATAGVGNPIVSTIETATAFFLSAVSILIPFLGFLMVLMVLFFIYKAYNSFKGKIGKKQVV